MKIADITDTWTVTNRAGAEIARVDGVSITTAREAALQIPAVAESSQREHGFGLRRLSRDEL